MISQASCLRDPSTWVLILGLTLAVVPIAHSAESNCPPSTTGPQRVCPPLGSVAAPRPINPEEFEQAQRALHEAQAQYDARPKPVPQTGILPGEMVQERFGSGYPFDVENVWIDIVDGKEVTVYSGAMHHDPEDDTVKYDPLTAHGFMIVQRGRLGEPGTTEKQIYTPTAVGSLRIVAARGKVLMLESRQGKKFSLNVKTEQLTTLGGQ